jgi:flavin reductase (DIM6/NTAB) family NADH-FMN oxidoreductase RutF
VFSWISLDTTAGLAPDAGALRASLGRFATGVCLVTAIAPDGKREGMTIHSFASVSLDPPLVLWSIGNQARSAGVFLGTGHFNISVLGADQKHIALHFARPSEDKFAPCEALFTAAANGVPRLRVAPATYECSVFSRYREGDHTLLIGRVGHFDGEDAEPLLFHAGRMGAFAELTPALANP